MNRKEKIRLYLETGVVAAGLILYFLCGVILLNEYHLAIKAYFGGH